jgi:hypothetical protein
MSPPARSLAYLRDRGFLAAVVESWVPRVQIRKDLFGFADVLAFHQRDKAFLLVQTTRVAHLAHRMAKARSRPELRAWIRAGGRFEVHGWARRGDRWECRVVTVAGEDLRTDLTARPRRGRSRQRGLFDGQERRDRPGKTTGDAQKAAGGAA